MEDLFPKFNVYYLLRGIIYCAVLTAFATRLLVLLGLTGGMQAMVIRPVCWWRLSFVPCSSDGGQRQDSPWCRWHAGGSPAHSFPRAIFVILLPFSSFRSSALRLAGAALEIDPTSERHAP